MAKYSFELKKKIVLEYLSGNMGSTTLAKNMTSKAKNRFGNGLNHISSSVMMDY
jgi:hypothetical protein